MRSRRETRMPAPRAGTIAVLEVEGIRFGLPAADILEVAPIRAYTPMPCQDPAHLGVVLHREKIVPLLDIGGWLGAPGGRAPIPGLCVVARARLGEVAFPIDRVLGVEAAAADPPMERLECPGGLTVLRGARWAERDDERAAD